MMRTGKMGDRARRGAALLAVLVLPAGCGTSDAGSPPPTPPAPSTSAATAAPTPTDVGAAAPTAPAPATAPTTAASTAAPPGTPALTETCSSPLGFTVQHPVDWDSPDGAQPCASFGPGGADGAPLTITVETDGTEPAGIPQVGDFTVAGRSEATVAGRPAVRTEGVWTGHGYSMTSAQLALWAVPLDGADVLVLRATGCCGVSFVDAAALLDQMAGSLTIAG